MGTTGTNELQEHFMGSIASGIIQGTSIPVLATPTSSELKEPETIIFTTNQFEKE